MGSTRITRQVLLRFLSVGPISKCKAIHNLHNPNVWIDCSFQHFQNRKGLQSQTNDMRADKSFTSIFCLSATPWVALNFGTQPIDKHIFRMMMVRVIFKLPVEGIGNLNLKFKYFDLGWQKATGVQVKATNWSDAPAFIDNGIHALLDRQQGTYSIFLLPLPGAFVRYILLWLPMLLIWCSRYHVYTWITCPAVYCKQLKKPNGYSEVQYK